MDKPSCGKIELHTIKKNVPDQLGTQKADHSKKKNVPDQHGTQKADQITTVPLTSLARKKQTIQ